MIFLLLDDRKHFSTCSLFAHNDGTPVDFVFTHNTLKFSA